MYSMCAQWRRVIMQCPTRKGQNDSVARRLECQSLESCSLLSPWSLSSQWSSTKVVKAGNATGYAITTDSPTRTATSIVPEWKVATTAITINGWRDLQHVSSRSSHCNNAVFPIASLLLISYQLLTATLSIPILMFQNVISTLRNLSTQLLLFQLLYMFVSASMRTMRFTETRSFPLCYGDYYFFWKCDLHTMCF